MSDVQQVVACKIHPSIGVARTAYYEQVQRWPDSMFWQRRQRREPLGHQMTVIASPSAALLP